MIGRLRRGIYGGAAARAPQPAVTLLDYNFKTGVYDGGGSPTALTLTRASAAVALTLAGAMSSFAVDVARITTRGLLVEAAATNIVSKSEEIDDAVWSKVAASVTADAVAAPDGATTADKVVEDTATSTRGVLRTHTVAAGVWTVGGFAKPAGRDWFLINIVDSGDHITWFDAANAVVGTNAAGTTAGIEALANGWVRWWASRTLAGTTLYSTFFPTTANNIQTYLGNGTSGMYAWGMQDEAGAVLSSYIKTTTGTAARSADVATLTLPAGAGTDMITVTHSGGIANFARSTLGSPTVLDLMTYAGNYIERVLLTT